MYDYDEGYEDGEDRVTEEFKERVKKMKKRFASNITVISKRQFLEECNKLMGDVK